jgi:hypothetical protein
MTIAKFVFLLLGMAVIIFIAGYISFNRFRSREDFNNSVIFMRSLIESSEVSQTAYRNILEAFREFDTMHYRDETIYKSLYTGFLFKYRDFLPKSDEPRIKIIPDNTEGYYNYKIER